MRYIGMRLVQLVVVLWLVVTFTFLLIRILPGDPVTIIVPNQIGPEGKKAAAAVRKDLGLDRPLYEQYGDYVGRVVQGDLGKDYGSGIKVTDTINQALPVSLQLMIYAQLIALLFAIPLGVLTAYRAGTKTDRAVNTSAFALLSVPNFVLAFLLSFFIGAQLKWLPTGGYAPGWLDQFFDSSRTWDVGEHFKDMLLPAITLAAGQIAVYMRLLRSDMIATLQENFITMAKSKGISEPAHPVAPRAAAVEPDAAHRRRPQRRRAHRWRGGRRSDLPAPGDGPEDLPGDQRPPVRRAPEPDPGDRGLLRRDQLLRRLLVHRPRPEDPPHCPGSRVVPPDDLTPGRGLVTPPPRVLHEGHAGDIAGDAGLLAVAAVEAEPKRKKGPRGRRLARDRLDGPGRLRGHRRSDPARR